MVVHVSVRRTAGDGVPLPSDTEKKGTRRDAHAIGRRRRQSARDGPDDARCQARVLHVFADPVRPVPRDERQLRNAATFPLSFSPLSSSSFSTSSRRAESLLVLSSRISWPFALSLPHLPAADPSAIFLIALAKRRRTPRRGAYSPTGIARAR